MFRQNFGSGTFCDYDEGNADNFKKKDKGYEDDFVEYETNVTRFSDLEMAPIPSVCNVCNKQCASKEALKAHRAAEHKKPVAWNLGRSLPLKTNKPKSNSVRGRKNSAPGSPVVMDDWMAGRTRSNHIGQLLAGDEVLLADERDGEAAGEAAEGGVTGAAAAGPMDPKVPIPKTDLIEGMIGVLTEGGAIKVVSKEEAMLEAKSGANAGLVEIDKNGVKTITVKILFGRGRRS